jgi:ADP-heptose:LPS heptosyltransferase
MVPAHSPVVIRFGRLGDTVLLQPLLRKLHLRYGRPCRLLTLGSWSPVLYSAQAEVEAFIPLRSQYGPLWLRPERWRAALVLRGMRDAPFYVCEPELRTRTKIRPMLELAGVPDAHCQFIEDLPLTEGEHWVDWLLRFGDTTPAAFHPTHGSSMPADCHAVPQLQVSSAERLDGTAWLQACGMADRSLVLFQPANKRTMRWNGIRQPHEDDKSWPVERWAALARAVSRRLPQAQILLCGAAAEAGYLNTLLAAMDTMSIRIGAAVLPLGRLKALLERAHSMVSVDTGPAHLAAALGCPLVVLFGARSPLLWSPRSGPGGVVTVLGGLPLTRRVDEIDTAQVVAAWRRLPSRPSASAEAGCLQEGARQHGRQSVGCEG